MNNVDTVIHYVKQIWNDKVPPPDPTAYHKYINALNRETLIKSAEKFGTPQYIIDADALAARGRFFLETFRKHIPNCDAFYATKCNDLPFILKTLKSQGFQADVAGLFELKLALKLKFDRIIFTSPGKDEQELALVVKYNKRVILNIDNLDELRRLQGYMDAHQVRRKINISFRVNPDSAVTKAWSKYGVELKDLKRIIGYTKKDKRLKLVGLHFHSSWNRTPERYLKKIKILGEYLKENLPRETRNLKFLDIGGGFYPEDVAILAKVTDKGGLCNVITDYADKVYDYRLLRFNPYRFMIREVVPLEIFASEISAQLEKYIYPINPKLRIYLEPGRFIVTHSTSILLKVIAMKSNSVICDGGINMVGDYRFEEYSFAPIVNLTRPSLNPRRRIIYGPLCDPSDLWGFSYFGDPIKKGDVLAVLHQGAYTYSCSWRFIKPTGPYVAYSSEGLQLVKSAEKFEDRYSGCTF